MIKQEIFGTVEGKEIYLFILENDFLKIVITNYGGIIQSLVVKKYGVDIVMGYDSLNEYIKDENYFGATIGRYANLIKGGTFDISGNKYSLSKNYGDDTLHGGKEGFNKKIWNYKMQENGLLLSYLSPDGEEGFPGNLKVEVLFSIEKNTLSIKYFAITDKDTAVNLTNHSYFNLNGHDSGSVLKHKVYINSDECTFKYEREMGVPYDDNYFLKNNGAFEKVASATGDITGLKMTVYTDRPCMQFYTAGELEQTKGKGVYKRYGALCFETQLCPNDINQLDRYLLNRNKSVKTITMFMFN